MSSTSEISQLINGSELIPKTIGGTWMLSLPVLAGNEAKPCLKFFWYPISGIWIWPPCYHIKASLETSLDIEYTKIQHPKEIGLNIDPGTKLGRIELKRIQDGGPMTGQLKQSMYQLADSLCKIYPKPLESLIDSERQTIQQYQELFSRLAPKILLPAYNSLNPHFFKWVEDSSIKQN
jgi:hypothetical protein